MGIKPSPMSWWSTKSTMTLIGPCRLPWVLAVAFSAAGHSPISPCSLSRYETSFSSFFILPYLALGKDDIVHLNFTRFSFCLFFQVEHGKYAEGLRWTRDILFYVDFEPARIKDIAKELAGRVSLTKRFGCRLLIVFFLFTYKPSISKICMSGAFLANTKRYVFGWECYLDIITS